MILPITNEKGETFFVGNDVAKALGYDQADKAVLRHVDEDDRTKHTVIDRKGRTQSLMSSMRATPCCVTLQVHVDEEDKTSYLIQVSGYNDKTTVANCDGGCKDKTTALIQGTGE